MGHENLLNQLNDAIQGISIQKEKQTCENANR